MFYLNIWIGTTLDFQSIVTNGIFSGDWKNEEWFDAVNGLDFLSLLLN